MKLLKTTSTIGLLGALSSTVFLAWSMLSGNEQADRSNLISLLALLCLTALWIERMAVILSDRRAKKAALLQSAGLSAGVIQLRAWTSAVIAGGAVVVSLIVLFPYTDLAISFAAGAILFGLPMFFLEKRIGRVALNGEGT